MSVSRMICASFDVCIPIRETLRDFDRSHRGRLIYLPRISLDLGSQHNARREFSRSKLAIAEGRRTSTYILHCTINARSIYLSITVTTCLHGIDGIKAKDKSVAAFYNINTGLGLGIIVLQQKGDDRLVVQIP